MKEWGREESAELQWCYPSLLNTSLHEDIDADGERVEGGLAKLRGDEERRKHETEGKVVHLGNVPITKTVPDHTDIEDADTINAPHSDETPPRKRVILMGSDSLLPPSPSKQPIKHLRDPTQKSTRTSGLDCGDIDPFVQSDSFVYLAVSAKPGSHAELTRVTEVLPPVTTKRDSVQQHVSSMKTPFNQSHVEHSAKLAQSAPLKPEEGDFLCTDSFIYLAAPACLLLGPEGTTSYSGRYVHFSVVTVTPVGFFILWIKSYNEIFLLSGSLTQRVQDQDLLMCQYMVVVQWQGTVTGTRIYLTPIPAAPPGSLLLVANLPAWHNPSGCQVNRAGTRLKTQLSLKCSLSNLGKRTETTTAKQGRLVGLPPAWR